MNHDPMTVPSLRAGRPRRPGGAHWHGWLVGIVLGFAILNRGSVAAPPLAERFANPPADTRILKIIHSWPDEPAQQDKLRARLVAQGFGGVVCNVAFDEYLESEAKWRAFVRAVQAARDAGMALWLYDEKGYPSGNAGGLVLRDHPEWEARGLLVADLECEAGPVSLDRPPGRLLLAAAFPIARTAPRENQRGAPGLGATAPASARRDSPPPIELRAQVGDRKLDWTAPAGRWHVVLMTEDRLYEGTHADGNLHRKMPYPNLIEAAPTARFIELTHARYAERLGPDLGRYFMATFTDEPSLMSMFLRRMPYRCLPWGPTLPAEFRRRRGYDLEPILGSLVTDTGPDTARHRHDYWLTVGELVSENFFGQIQRWCQAHHIPSGGHLLAEENVVAHVPLYGDFLRCLRRLDAPSMDCLTSVPAEVPWYVARLVSSAAELEGRALVMSETSDHSQVWRPAGDARPKRVVTEAEIRGTCNRQFVNGVNVITSYYSFTGLTDDALRRLNEWVGRCATLLRGGRARANVAVVYPVESLWTRFVPASHWANASPAANRVEHAYRHALDTLFETRREFTVVDSQALVAARLEDGALKHGEAAWRVVILPGVDTLPAAAWKALLEFARTGGVVVALGARPANSEREFPDRGLEELARTLFGNDPALPSIQPLEHGGGGVYLPDGFEGLLPEVLNSVIEPVVAVSEAGAPVRVALRRLEDHDVCFLINDSDRPWTGDVRLNTRSAGEHWDPATGRSAPVAAGGPYRLALEPYGAAFLRFASVDSPARRPLDAGTLPALDWQPLKLGDPIVSRGEFVREELGLDPARSTPTRPVWRAKARLTKGAVDTFLFVRFPTTPGFELNAADSLAFETWVPDGQRAPTQLLVILKEQDGGDFLATTPRPLNAGGRDRSMVPLRRFTLAGWSQDADGQLDPRRIAEVRIGWGGYFGAEGETIEFSVAGVQAVRRGRR